MASCREEPTDDLIEVFCKQSVRRLLVRRLSLKELLVEVDASELSEAAAEKRKLFHSIIPEGHLGPLQKLASDGNKSPECVNDEFLGLINNRSLGGRKLSDFVKWLDIFHPEICAELHRACPVAQHSQWSIGVSTSTPLYSLNDSPTMCERCVDVLSPLLDESGDWAKLYDALSHHPKAKPFFTQAQRAAVAQCGDGGGAGGGGKQTEVILSAWCRLLPLREATLSQLVRLLHGERCFKAVYALADRLKLKGESRGVREMIVEAADRCGVGFPNGHTPDGSFSPEKESCGRRDTAWGDMAVVDIEGEFDDERFRPLITALDNTNVDAVTSATHLYKHLRSTEQIEQKSRLEPVVRPGQAKRVLAGWLWKDDALKLCDIRATLQACGLTEAVTALANAFANTTVVSLETSPVQATLQPTAPSAFDFDSIQHHSESSIIMDEQG
eukprot:scpid76533/ scgid29635/ 